MAMNFPSGVTIIGTGAALPEQVLTNEDLTKIVDTSDEWIKTRTGISERRLAASHEATSDLAVRAAREALDNAGISPEELDLIIVTTVTPDMFFPATACLVQEQLQAFHAAAFDLEAACTGFIYGLTIGCQFIAAGAYRYVLVIGADTLSRITDYSDRSTCVLFGDGAGAAVLAPCAPGAGILSTFLGADGRGAELLTLPAGGSRLPASAETVLARQHYIQMNGNEVFRFAVRIIGEASEKALAKAGLTQQDIDVLIPHQANQRIIEAAVKKLDMTADKVEINLDKYGNMSNASIPVALHEAWQKGKIKAGKHILLVGFGAGLTYGAAVVRWTY